MQFPGPCTPMVSVISISAVRDGPLTSVTAGDFAISGLLIAASIDGKMSDARSTAIWISGSRDAVIGLTFTARDNQCPRFGDACQRTGDPGFDVLVRFTLDRDACFR